VRLSRGGLLCRALLELLNYTIQIRIAGAEASGEPVATALHPKTLPLMTLIALMVTDKNTTLARVLGAFIHICGAGARVSIQGIGRDISYSIRAGSWG
jgi:hypothetical protein